MAIFDGEQKRIVVRVVYDGPAFAGKTTNVRRLYSFFSARRRSELYVPAERDGRTLYFDWLQLDGGLVGGHPLRAQLVTVPGQDEFVHRRALLVGGADVVVFVCDARPSGLREAAPMLAWLRDNLARRAEPVAIVVQANKQDLEGALDPAAVARELGLGPDEPVVGARAHDGGGVRETAIVAIRLAATSVQRALIDGGIARLLGRAQSGEALYEAMLCAEPAPAAPTAVPAAVPPPADDDGGPPELDLSAMFGAPAEPAPARDPAPAASNVEAPLPSPDEPPGYIWPATTGRDLLRRLGGAGPPRRHVEPPGRQGEGAAPDAIVYEIGLWCARTSTRRRYPGVEEGRAALLSLARRKTLLGRFLPRRTTLALREDGDGGHWLWTISPWLTTTRELMNHACEHDDEGRLGEALVLYAGAAVEAALMALRHGVVLDVHPSNFGAIGRDTYYVGDDIAEGEAMPGLARAVAERVEDEGAARAAVESYLAAFEAAVRARLTPADVRCLGLVEGFEALEPRSVAAAAARARLSRFLREFLAEEAHDETLSG